MLSHIVPMIYQRQACQQHKTPVPLTETFAKVRRNLKTRANLMIMQVNNQNKLLIGILADIHFKITGPKQDSMNDGICYKYTIDG